MNENVLIKQFNELTVSKLKDICKEYNLSGYSSLKKAEIINLIIKSLEEQDLDKVMEKYGILPEKIIPDKKVRELIDTGRKIDDRTYLSYLFQSLNKEDLKDICREFNIKGYSKYKKADLIEFILDSLAEEEYRLIIYEKEKNIISDEIQTALNKIQGKPEERETLKNIMITNEEMHDVELTFSGMNWKTSTFVSIRKDNIDNPMRDCDCRVGSNMGFCNHFWVGFIFSLKNRFFKLSDWTLTTLPDDFEKTIEPIQIAGATQSTTSKKDEDLTLIDENSEKSILMEHLDSRITVYEGKIEELEKRTSEFQDHITEYYMVMLKDVKIGPQIKKKSDYDEEQIKTVDNLRVRISDNKYRQANISEGDTISLNGTVDNDGFWGLMLKRSTKVKKL